MENSDRTIQIITDNIAGRQLLIWGAWRYGKQLAEQLKNVGLDVYGYIDSNKYGTTYQSLPVYEPSIINPANYYIAVSIEEHPAVFQMLDDFGYIENMDYIGDR